MARVRGVAKLQANLRRAGEAVQGNGGEEVMRAGGDVIRDEARSNIRRKLNKNPRGVLEGATVTWVVSDKKAEIGPRGVVYAAIHEFGGVITPKRAAALRFEIDGEVIFTQRVVMPQRAYLRPAADTKGAAAAKAMGVTIDELIIKAIR